MTRRSPQQPSPAAVPRRAARRTPGEHPTSTAGRRLAATPHLCRLIMIVTVAACGATFASFADAAGGAQARPASDASNVPGFAVSGNPVAEIPLDRLSATRERPLFSPSRRPPFRREPAPMVHVEQAPPPPPPITPPSVALYGIVVGLQGPRAFIATGPSERIVRVRPGDDVDGWRVTAISERRLVLSRADLSATFTLFSPENAGRTARPGSVQPIPTLVAPRTRIR
ncbi:MAG: hypothetical protein ABSG76_13115 [Xanthobacteraceae bacterium]|jgi:general secretion pathway protein N